MQVTQQIFVAEEWVKNSLEEVNAEVQSRLTAEKAVGVLRLEKESLSEKVKEAIKAQASAEAGLKTTTRQAEDMRQQLHLTEINLATEKQAVLDLKAQLQQAKEAARVAREAAEAAVAEAAVAASYEHGVKDTEARLTEEVVVVCRDYYTESWGVLADSKLRRIENIFFLEDIREIPNSDPPEKLVSAPTAVLDPVIPKGKGMDEEAQPSAKDKSSEDALTIRDVVSRAKDAESKSKAGDDHPETDGVAKSPTKYKA